MRKNSLFLILMIFLFSQPHPVQAQSAPSCSFQADGSIVCVTGGGGSGGGNDGNTGNGGNNGNNPPATSTVCIPGATRQQTIYRPEPSLGPGQCSVWENKVSDCTGEILFGSNQGVDACPQASIQPQHPCTSFSINASGITCGNTEWKLSARITFPEIYLDVRPYPATLVRWPTAIRNGGIPESKGSGGVNYVPYGGGSPNNPQVGDWQDLRLLLTLRPAGPMTVTLPYINTMELTDQGPTGSPTLFQWEVPSHPVVGGGPLAGSINGLNELPADIPLFVGNGHAPYRLFWELHYEEYESIEGCASGPGANGSYNCGGGTGHRDIIGYDWKRHSSGGEIPPSAVKNLPASLGADINHDGVPDGYWDNNLTLRRMDDNNRVDNPIYRHSWNWGGIIYWAVREGQGQIGWPGQ